MVFSILVIFLSIAAVSFAANHDSYSRYSVHGIELQDISDQELLLKLQLSLHIDIWQYGWPGRRDAHVMVSPENSAEFLDKLDENGVKHYLRVADVSKSLEEFDEELTRYRESRSGRLVPFLDYPRYLQVNAYLQRIAAEYPDIVTLVNAGPSFEGRDVMYLKISTTNFADTSKPVYFMNAMLHAREWVTTPVALYSIHRLVEELRDGDRDLLDGTDWIIMPLVNPDGYEYSHTDFRLWRRTRSINLSVSSTCVGVDANRNFDVKFNTIGVSADPCNDVYPGTQPFSEPETGYVRDVLHEYLDRIQIYMDIHSHGNYVLFGFGNRTLPSNGISLHHVGAAMGAAMDVVKLPAAGFYLVGNSAMVLYVSSGSAQDYGQHVGVPFSYTLELPGYGNGFQVPPQFINHINEETWLGIAATARIAKIHYSARLVNPPPVAPPEPSS